MVRGYRRKKYLIHPSSQITYIACSILPALIMSLFCTYFLINSGELVLKAAKEKPLMPFHSIRQTIVTLEKEGYTADTATKVTKLKQELNSLRNILETIYRDTLTQWDKTKRVIFIVLFSVLLLVGLLALLYSHRVVGPLIRIKRDIDMLCEDKDIPPVKLRKNDQFKDLAESLDKLRSHLKDRGLLEQK
jgi:hypothetical protein